MPDLYKERKLSEGYPNLDELAVDYFVRTQSERPDDTARVLRVLKLIDRLIAIPSGASVCVIGCGPVPQTLKVLRESGHRAVGVEPIPEFVERARKFLDDPESVHVGAAECLPLADKSMDIVFLESVLEHVESPQKSLSELFRVIRPGGVAYVATTNRQRFSITGNNAEFRVPFLSHFPRLLRESYVYAHLHYRPALANFTRRPAVHWFSYADLCALGREAGFAQFYSSIDLRRPEDQVLSRNPILRLMRTGPFFRMLQRNAWLRSLALTQIGSDIFMWRRGE
jgi:ubiquinone/menaquinone biosynthesis C-methylase UbiE